MRRSFAVLSFAVGAALTFASAAHAAATAYTYIGSATGSNLLWGNSAYWSPTGVPGTDTGDTVVATAPLNTGLDVNGPRTVAAFTWSAGAYQIISNGTPSSSLTVTGTFTKDTNAGTLTVRQGGGQAMAFTAGNVVVNAGELFLQGMNTTVTGSTSVGTGAKLALGAAQASTTPELGDLTLAGTGNVYLDTGTLSSPPGTVDVTSLAGSDVTSIVAADSTNTAGSVRSAILHIEGTASAAYAGKLLNNAGSNSGSLLAVEKAGTNAETLSGNLNTYSGGTTISGGALIVTNTLGSATGGGAVTVTGSTATLAGTGTVSGAAALVTVDSGGHLAAGVNAVGINFGSAGTLNLGLADGGVTLNDANLDFDLGSTALGLNDLIDTSGTLTLGRLQFNFNELDGTLQTGVSYTLIGGASSVSGFDVGAITTTGDVGYTPTYNLAGNDVTVTFAANTPVPEPATLSLLGVASAGLLIRRRRGQRVRV